MVQRTHFYLAAFGTIAWCVTALLVKPVLAENGKVFRYENEDGSVVYSSDPPFTGAKPAQLPEITRGEMKLRGKSLATCQSHGGHNCQAGPDADGSVICFDGFRDASAIFQFTCSSAKLSIAEVKDVGQTGGFSVMIRNEKSVAAKTPQVEVRVEKGKLINLVGPSEIEAFGVGEFVLDVKDIGLVKQKPQARDVVVTCLNCS